MVDVTVVGATPAGKTSLDQSRLAAIDKFYVVGKAEEAKIDKYEEEAAAEGYISCPSR